MFETTIRIIFGPNGEEGTGNWRNLYAFLHNLFSSEDIMMIKARKMRW